MKWSRNKNSQLLKATERYKPFKKMKIKKILLLLSIATLFHNCQSQSQCPEGINLLPMYGQKEKCQEQLDDDKEFLAEMDKNFKSRQESSKALSSKGWEYFYRNDFETAMKRFNQAWLLDNNNYEAYWGFANIRGKQNQLEEARNLFDLAKKLNPTNANFFISSASTYGGLYNQKKDIALLNSMRADLQRANQLDPNNPQVYAELAAVHFYLNDKTKALEYLKKAEHLDPSVINPNLKKALTK